MSALKGRGPRAEGRVADAPPAGRRTPRCVGDPVTLCVDGVERTFGDAVAAALAVRERYYAPLMRTRAQAKAERIALGKALCELKDRLVHGEFMGAYLEARMHSRRVNMAMDEYRRSVGLLPPKPKPTAKRPVQIGKHFQFEDGGSDLPAPVHTGAKAASPSWTPDPGELAEAEAYAERERRASLGLEEGEEAESASGIRHSAFGSTHRPSALGPRPFVPTAQADFAPLYAAAERLRAVLARLAGGLRLDTVGAALIDDMEALAQRLEQVAALSEAHGREAAGTGQARGGHPGGA